MNLHPRLPHQPKLEPESSQVRSRDTEHGELLGAEKGDALWELLVHTVKANWGYAQS